MDDRPAAAAAGGGHVGGQAAAARAHAAVAAHGAGGARGGCGIATAAESTESAEPAALGVGTAGRSAARLIKEAQEVGDGLSALLSAALGAASVAPEKLQPPDSLQPC
eukprot:364026-Chlamydomonas_euryale.AAC.3